MKRFLLSATILMLFMSGWSHVLAAAFCPHVMMAQDCCPAQSGAGHDHGTNASHEAMQMDGMEGMERQAPVTPGDATPANAEIANVVSQPVEDCSHCMGHSQLPTAPVAAGTADQSSRNTDVAAPPVSQHIAPPVPAFATLITSKPHGPPGTAASRLVLIGVFRI